MALPRHINDLMQQMFDEYGGVLTIDWMHAMIHAGKAWMITGQSVLASGVSHGFLFATGANKHAHLNLSGLIRSTGESNVTIYKNPPDVSGGNACACINMNDEHSATAPEVVVTEGVTITDAGTDIKYEAHVGSGQNNGGDLNSRHEFELDTNSEYLVVHTSEAAANDVSWDMNFYEP